MYKKIGNNYVIFTMIVGYYSFSNYLYFWFYRGAVG